MIDLENLPKEEHYDIPADYFDNLPKQVMNTIHKDKARRRNLWISSVAAVMVALICTTFWIQFSKSNDDSGKEVISKTEKAAPTQLEERVIDYYNNEYAQMDYIYYDNN